MTANSIDELAAWMRANGARRICLQWPQAGVFQVTEIELSDTIPAPPPFESDEVFAFVDPKPPGICAHGDCGEPAGGIGAPELCRSHALMAAGVSR